MDPVGRWSRPGEQESTIRVAPSADTLQTFEGRRESEAGIRRVKAAPLQELFQPDTAPKA